MSKPRANLKPGCPEGPNQISNRGFAVFPVRNRPEVITRTVPVSTPSGGILKRNLRQKEDRWKMTALA